MSTVVRRAIYNRLVTDSTLTGQLGAAAPGYTWGVYHNVAPDHATPPFVIFSKSSGVPTDKFRDPAKESVYVPAYETDVWMIKAVDHNTTADRAEAISNEIISRLNDADLGGNGVPTLYLRRESDVEYSELIEGDLYQHVGALYRLVRN